MLPTFASNHFVNALLGHPKFLGEHVDTSISRTMFRPDPNHIRFGQFGPKLSLDRLPAFLNHVLNIIPWRSLEKVKWIAAWREIAMVTNEHAVIDGAIGQFPGNAMGLFIFKPAVSSFVGETVEYPAGVFPSGLVNKTPKSVSTRSFAGVVSGSFPGSTRVAAKLPTTTVDIIARCEERHSACLANPFDFVRVCMRHLIASLQAMRCSRARSVDALPGFSLSEL